MEINLSFYIIFPHYFSCACLTISTDIDFKSKTNKNLRNYYVLKSVLEIRLLWLSYNTHLPFSCFSNPITCLLPTFHKLFSWYV